MARVQMPPDPVFTRRAWITPAQNQVNRSGWTGGRKVSRLPGAGIWRVSATLKSMSREAETWPWKAFFAALEGEANTFLMPYACKQTAAPNPVVRIATQGQTTAELGGMPVSKPYLPAGRALTFIHPSGRRQLVLLTKDLIADALGTGIATFRGALRETSPAGAPVEARDPVCEVALPQGAPPGWEENEGVTTLTFDAEEAF